jgi:hypothetical protein
MDQRKNARAHNRENRHRFGRAVIDVRQRCRVAEMSVPAWPIPIHHTKFVMSQAHMTGCRFPQTPTPVE